MNLKEEYEKIEQHTKVEWFKAKPGKYTIVIIGEPEETEFIEDTTGKVTQQIVLNIEIMKERYKWTINKGITFSSLYGQLMILAKRNNWSTNGLLLTLLVKSDGYKNDYTILEVVDEK